MKQIFRTSFVTIWVAMIFFSCQKNTVSSTSAVTYVKSIDNLNANYIAVNSFQLSDGNYLLAGKDPSNNAPGWLVKFTINGTIIWQKSLSQLVTILWSAFSVQGGGFVAAGYDATPSDNELHVILYDVNANIISSQILNPGSGCAGYPLQMLQLNNGGFAFAGSALDINKYPAAFLLITGNTFNQLYIKVYSPLNGEHTYGVSGLCQAADSTIDITGSVNLNNIDNAYLIKAYPDAVLKSFTYLTDSNIYETPSCMTLNNKGNLMVINSSADINYNKGALVNYKNTGVSSVSGIIGINTLDYYGSFTGSVNYLGYSNYGLINSVNYTQDGGYILCGTVNQLNIQSSTTEIYLLKLDAGLNQLWAKIFNTYYNSVGVSACQTNDGGYLVSGYQTSFATSSGMVLIKTDANGNVN